MFDLTIFPLAITSGKEQHDLPGLLAVAAPRKAERMRAGDLLVLYVRLVTPSGSPVPFTHAQQKEILSRLAETYFTSAGSVTAGLRAAVVRLNDFILNRNLKAGIESQTIGILNLAAVHGSNLVVAHSGPTHSFFINKEKVQHFDDSQGMRGLGTSRQAVPRFYQMPVEGNDLLLLCPDPPSTWMQSLAGSSTIGFEGLRRRLLNNVSADMQVIALRFAAGRGQVSFWRPSAQRIGAVPEKPQPKPAQSLQPRASGELKDVAQNPPSISVPPAAISLPETKEQESPAIPLSSSLPQVEKVRQKEKQKAAPPKPEKPGFGSVLRLQLANAWKTARQIRTQVDGATSKVLPKRPEPLVNLSASVMLLVAIMVPVMVVTVATTVYFRAGRTEQFAILLGQAETYALQAVDQQDPQLRKQAWTSAFSLVEEAEKYSSSEESTALRRKALAALDEIEGITRLPFQPALSNTFGPGVNITRMVATLNQVFLLDSNQGRILSMTRTTTGGYEANLSFSCSPAKAGAAIVGSLIDLAELPVNNEFGADIMGIDDAGNLVYCSSGDEGFNSQALALPDLGWGSLTGITTYGDTLYVLDPARNAVYVYYGEKGVYAGKPHLYFGTDIPMMTDVIDLAVDQEFLYLLHADGRMTLCTSGSIAFGNTRCTDPSPYGDGRTGKEPSPLTFPGVQLVQVQTTQPPDPSLFALDSANQAVYHLSQRRMNLQHIYMNSVENDFPFPDTAATAFAVTPNRRVLIALGDQIFIAPLP